MQVNLKFLLGFGCLFLLIVVFLIYHRTVSVIVEEERLRVVTPLPAPKMMDLPQFQGEHKESLYWGTYRSLVYLGIRARTPRSLIAGLMWIGIKNGQYFMRHVCQDSDELSMYGWTRHNGRDYGHQVLVDQDLTLTTSFLKAKTSGSGFGGDWAVRVAVHSEKSKLDDETWKAAAHVFFYLADEGGNAFSIGKEGSSFYDDSLLVSGSRDDIGDWELHLDSTDNLEIHYSGFRSPHMHNLSELFQQSLAVHASRTGRIELPDTSEQSPNIFVFQVSGKLPFKMDTAFISGGGLKGSRVKERVNNLSGALLTNQLNEREKDFEDKYRRCFNVTGKVDPESAAVGRAAIGNMLGGIGYFYGQSKIVPPKDSNIENDKYVSYWPAALYSAVPSRSFFPRGFLWDEGFHQLLIWRWDIAISLDIIGHWLDLMNIDGWIPREQILGAEALSKVPEEFVLQNPTNANPPTLFLVLRDLVNAMKRNKFTAAESDQISVFMERAFIRLEAWFNWFNTTQNGKDKDTGSFYWHGRDNVTTRELNPKTLSSGLDDYPRASHPSEDERHLDLRCWMLLAADCMHSIGELLGMKNNKEKGYYAMAKNLSDFEALNQMHLDVVTGAYFDFGNHTEKVRLRWHEVNGRMLIREVAERPQLRLVPHLGYVSLFPFMLRIPPPASWVLKKQLDLLSNRSTLWTNYGIRSLSKTSSLYMKRNTEHDPPYWRGPIWINMNYMILSALHHYSQEDGPYKSRAKTLYEELRKNIIGNVVGNYFQTGYLWEQYDEKNKGKGKGARPFTGWTSLILLMMAEVY